MRAVKLNEHLWEIPRADPMRVPGRIYASERIMKDLREDPSLNQVANVACLPGILGYSLAMPDIHWGYGFPIGGVAAVDAEEGVISPGGVGYDINCGVRLMRTNLGLGDVKRRIDQIADALFAKIPAGVGSAGAIRSLKTDDLRQVVIEGSKWALKNGYAGPNDLDRTEDGGCLDGANPDAVSAQAYARGTKQLGTLGSGNHFLEVAVIDEVYDDIASALNLERGRITVMIHSGSRGLGHQVCEDHLKIIIKASSRYDIQLPDRQLAAAPIKSPEGQAYLSAMTAAANFAWCNRQVMMHHTEEAMMDVLSISPRELGFALVYDVCHNIAKFEEHTVGGRARRVCVHRKGATRAFSAGHQALPTSLRRIGQPVLIPGDMGRYSFVTIGLEGAMRETFGSSCHGAGRLLSRSQARKKSDNPFAELKERGVTVRARSRAGVAEEMPSAYKDVADVVAVMEAAGITRRIARLKPLAVIKG